MIIKSKTRAAVSTPALGVALVDRDREHRSPGLFLTPPNSSPESSMLRMQEHRAATGNSSVDHGPPIRQLPPNSAVSSEVSLGLYHHKDHNVTLPLGPELKPVLKADPEGHGVYGKI